MYQEEDANSESKKEDACRVYLQFIDILIEAFASQPKVIFESWDVFVLCELSLKNLSP